MSVLLGLAGGIEPIESQPFDDNPEAIAMSRVGLRRAALGIAMVGADWLVGVASLFMSQTGRGRFVIIFQIDIMFELHNNIFPE
jgi:hypothetical protein